MIHSEEDQELKEEEVNKGIFLPTSIQEYDVFNTPEGYKGHFPKDALATYGCKNCGWRGTHECPYKFESGKVKQRKHPIWTGLKFPENVKVEGICSYKKNYLILLAGEWDKRPTYDMWHSRLMKNKGVIQNSKDELRYLKTAKELELLETRLKVLNEKYVAYYGSDDDSNNEQLDKYDKDIKELKKELAEKKREYSTVRGEMIQSWSMLEGFFEKGVDRETAKKIDMNVTKTSIPHSQLLEIMRGDYEVIEDEE